MDWLCLPNTVQFYPERQTDKEREKERERELVQFHTLDTCKQEKQREIHGDLDLRWQ